MHISLTSEIQEYGKLRFQIIRSTIPQTAWLRNTIYSAYFEKMKKVMDFFKNCLSYDIQQ